MQGRRILMLRAVSTMYLRSRTKQMQLRRATAEPLESRMFLTGSPYENRGWVSIIVDHTVASSVSADLAQLQQDLIGDGWTSVSVHTDAPRMDDGNYVWH